jgi:hypothetical protein
MRCRPELLLCLLLACGAPDDDADTGTSGETTEASSDTGETPTTGDASTTGEAWASLDERPCPDDSALSSENFGGPFLLTHCTGCHHSSLGEAERAGAPVGVDFDSLDDVRARADRIWARAADHNTSMPPAGGPAPDERVRLGEWLACGAPTAAEL